MRSMLLTAVLVVAGCSSSPPASPTSTSPPGSQAAASYGMVGFVTVVGTPAPGEMTVQVTGGTSAIVDANGRFELAAVPATATGLTLRADGRDSAVRFPMSPLTGPSLLLEVRLDVVSGAAVVSRLCSTSSMSVGSPGTAIVSMCVAPVGG